MAEFGKSILAPGTGCGWYGKASEGIPTGLDLQYNDRGSEETAMYGSVVTVAALLIAGALPAAPDDLEDAFQKLKQAEATRDAALVKKVAADTCALAREIIATPLANAEYDKEEMARRIAYARDVELYSEYALFATALQARPAAAIDLLGALEQQNPKSKYLDGAYGAWFLALNQTGAGSRIPAIAERAVANFPENEDLLLVLADTAMNRKQTDRALGYAERLLAVLRKHPKPESLSAADWERKRSAALGRSRWIAGVAHSEKNQHYEADQDLRAALPLVKGDDVMTASALFYLGLANYQLAGMTRDKARMLEAVKFSEQAAAVKGPFSQQAWRNAQLMRREAERLR